ncbi:MAG: hypothetical protein ACE5JS_23035 [Nitrospinota bacterium]
MEEIRRGDHPGEIPVLRDEHAGGIVQALLAETKHRRSWKKVAAQVDLVADGFAPNPVGPAKFYLNVRLTKKLRGGTLPRWAADPRDRTRVNCRKVVRVIGRHHFLNLCS